MFGKILLAFFVALLSGAVMAIVLSGLGAGFWLATGLTVAACTMVQMTAHPSKSEDRSIRSHPATAAGCAALVVMLLTATAGLAFSPAIAGALATSVAMLIGHLVTVYHIASAENAPQLLIISDPGKSMDDENAFILLARLARLALLKPLGVVACLMPAEMRARLTKGTLNLLGLRDVFVAVGSDCGIKDTGESAHEFEGVSYLHPRHDLAESWVAAPLLLSSAPGKSVTVLIIAGMTDAAQLLRTHESLFLQKVREVIIMGGVRCQGNRVALSDYGFMVPDTASNNMFDLEASTYVYSRLQHLGIPLVIISREAAYACKIPRKHYENLAATGHLVGIKLRLFHKRILDALWRRSNYPIGDERREGLPARCTRDWFLQSFCNGEGSDRKGEDGIWDLVTHDYLYDPIALIACVPSLRSRFFAPEAVVVKGTTHLVIGVSPTKRGIVDPDDLAGYLMENILKGLSHGEPSQLAAHRESDI